MDRLADTMWRVAVAAFRRYRQDRVDRLAAALAYHSIFALAPMAMVGVALSKALAMREDVRAQFLTLVSRFASGEVAEALEPLMSGVRLERTGAWAGAVGVAITVYGASKVFLQLQDAFNSIWRAPGRPPAWWRTFLRSQAVAFLLSIVIGVVVMLGPMVTGVLGHFDHQWDTFMVSIAIETVLFAVLYRVLPTAPPPWRDLWPGAFFAATLFAIGQQAFSIYLRLVGATSVFGAAGSLVALMLWIYVSAQILLVGAEFVQALRVLRHDPLSEGASEHPRRRSTDR